MHVSIWKHTIYIKKLSFCMLPNDFTVVIRV